MHRQFQIETLLVDARPFQDDNYRYRGVGQHSSSLLRAIREHEWPRRRPSIVAMVDHRLSPMHDVHVALFDDCINGVRPHLHTGTSFLSLSPMTHDPLWTAALLTDPNVYRVALFYDLIPLEFPDRYLRSSTLRSDYLVSIAWLRFFDAYACISQHSADALTTAARVDASKVFVSGVALRPELEPSSNPALSWSQREFVLVASGGDPRKNPECALRAHAGLKGEVARRLSLKIFGNHHHSVRDELRRVYAQAGGDPLRVEFFGHLSDDALKDLYRRALVTVIPSVSEGFSIPIIESSAAGTPALVSNVGAHAELVKDPGLRFDPHSPDELRSILQTAATSEATWQAARKQQATLWSTYSTEQVGRRFIQGLFGRKPAPAAAYVRKRPRPRIALLSPMPPAKSGVADYSAATLSPLANYAELYLFTDSSDVLPNTAFRSRASVKSASLALRGFDRVVSVIGNSDHHTSIVDYLLEFGGSAIAHDARMIGFYMGVYGEDRALRVARQEVPGCSINDVRGWLHNQSKLPALFLSEIAKAAAPLIVHSRTTAAEILRQYGVAPKVLPFAQYRPISSDKLKRHSRAVARRRLGYSERDIIICSFGFVSDDKAPDEILWATRLLVDWGLSARLVYCGVAFPSTHDRLRVLATDLGLLSHVHFFEQSVPETTYVDHLLAVDVGIQLRTYRMGGLSGGLGDCIAAALPTVANDHLAAAMEAPSFVRRVPDDLSPVLVAEAILDIVQSNNHRERPLEVAFEERRKRSAEAYAKQLLQILDLSD